MGSKRKPFEAGIETLDRDRLLGFLREQLPDADDITLSDIGPGAHGVSRDHFVFDLTWSIGSSVQEWPLVLIRDGDRPGQTDRAKEFRLLQTLEQTAIPTPKVFWHDTSGQWLERPFIVMQRIGGRATPPMKVVYREDPILRRKMAGQFMDILIELHRLDWQKLELGFLGVPQCAPKEFGTYRMNRLDSRLAAAEINEPHPTLDRALAWCRTHAPPARCFSICHGDYKPDNVLHEDGRILAIVDWERVRIADPIADLAYVCVPHLRAGGLAVGLAELGYVLQRYQEGTGFEVDESHLLFWEILLMLETVLYFQSLIADGRRHGNEASPLEPLVPRLIGLIEQTLG